MNPVTITQYYYESTETTEVTSNKATPSPQHASHHTIEHSKYEASNATRELDDLMASLSEFKVSIYSYVTIYSHYILVITFYSSHI